MLIHLQAEIFCMCVLTSMINYYHYYRFNVTFLCRTITSHLSLYYPYYHDLTWVLPHIRTAVALGSYYLAF